MSTRTRLAKLESMASSTFSEEEFSLMLGESILRGKGSVHYVLTHPDGCFKPPIAIGRTVKDITLEEIVAFQNTPWSVIDELDREIAQFLIDYPQPYNEI